MYMYTATSPPRKTLLVSIFDHKIFRSQTLYSLKILMQGDGCVREFHALSESCWTVKLANNRMLHCFCNCKGEMSATRAMMVPYHHKKVLNTVLTYIECMSLYM